MVRPCRSIDGRPVYAATDLVAYLACEHLTQLERAALAGLVKRPMRDDPELDIIRKRGFEHEKRYLADLDGRGPDGRHDRAGRLDRGPRRASSAPRPPRRSRRWRRARTSSTRRPSSTARWRGHADFLLRVDDADRPSVWGPYHYEVADTKLARHVKASAVLQICSYVDQLERDPGRPPGVAVRRPRRERPDGRAPPRRRLHGLLPERARPVPGDDAPTRRRPTYPPAGTYPEPVEHCDVCRWAAECVARRRSRRPPQPRRRHLAPASAARSSERGVATLEALGDARPADAAAARGHERSRRSSASASRPASSSRDGATGAPRYELLLPEPATRSSRNAGLASLPPPSPGDLFFDIEGDPYAFDDGLDYLFGVLEIDGTFHAFWSRDDDGEFTLDGERRGVRAADGLLHRAPRGRPDAAHLPLRAVRADRAEAAHGPLRHARGRRSTTCSRRASWSTSARRPAVAAGVGRELLDQEDGAVLRLRARDRPARRGLAASSPSSSGSSSARASGRQPTTSSGSSATTATTSSATTGCATGWKSAATSSRRLTGHDGAAPAPRETPIPAETDRGAGARPGARRPPGSTERSSRRPAERTPEQHARWLLAQLLGWHRREDKATWWEFFRLMELTPEELVDEDDADRPARTRRPARRRAEGQADLALPFPDQELRPRAAAPSTTRRSKQADPDGKPFDWDVGELVAVDRGRARRSTSGDRRGRRIPRAVVPLDRVARPDHQARLFELGEWVAEHGIDGDGPVPGRPRPAARPTAARGTGGRRRRCAGRTRPTSRPRAGSALDARPARSLADPGPARRRARRTPARG